jgi:hypothetical protein
MNPHITLSLFHILLIAPFFFYVAFQRSALPQAVYYVLLGLGILLVLYHGFKAIARLRTNSPYAWVNMIHALLVAPLLIYIGAQQRDTPRAAYEMMAMLGFAVFGYHMYSLVISINSDSA